MTDLGYQRRLQDALDALRRAMSQGGTFERACDHAARAWRVSFRDLEAAYRAREDPL
jgi:hypothetical protein